jgi:hypothetical protein
LDRILGFERSQDEIMEMICHSQKGVQGLYECLKAFIEQGGAVGGLLKGKVTTLMMMMVG